MESWGNKNTFKWMHHLDGWGLFLFATGTCFLFGEGEQQFLGIVMAFSIPLANYSRISLVISKIFPIPIELKMYTAWVVWTVITGVLVAEDVDSYFHGVKVLLQVFIMVWAAYLILSNIQSDDVVFYGILFGSLVQIVVVLKGEGNIDPMYEGGFREMGTSFNANLLGSIMVWGAFCAITFWKRRGKYSFINKTFVVSYIIIANYVMLLSGSRKSTMAMAILVVLWIIYANSLSKMIIKKFVQIIIGVAMIIIVIQYLLPAIEQTPAGARFLTFIDSGGNTLESKIDKQERYELYIEGLKIFIDNPIFGVGHNNFQYHYKGGIYSHSNYLEPLATTGVLGFILFQTFYIVPIFRIRRLLRIVENETTIYKLKTYLICLIAMLVIGIGAPFYMDSIVYLLLTAICFTTWKIENSLLILQADSGIGNDNGWTLGISGKELRQEDFNDRSTRNED